MFRETDPRAMTPRRFLMILGNECAAKVQEIMADEPYEGMQIRNENELSRYTQGTTLAAFVVGGGEAQAPCTMVFRWAPNPQPSNLFAMCGEEAKTPQITAVFWYASHFQTSFVLVREGGIHAHDASQPLQQNGAPDHQDMPKFCV